MSAFVIFYINYLAKKALGSNVNGNLICIKIKISYYVLTNDDTTKRFVNLDKYITFFNYSASRILIIFQWWIILSKFAACAE